MSGAPHTVHWKLSGEFGAPQREQFVIGSSEAFPRRTGGEAPAA
jgi:hypothetical protein